MDSGPSPPSLRSSRPLSGFGGGSLVRATISARLLCPAPGRTSNRLCRCSRKKNSFVGTDTIGQKPSRNCRMSARIPPKMGMRCRSSIRASCIAHSGVVVVSATWPAGPAEISRSDDQFRERDRRLSATYWSAFRKRLRSLYVSRCLFLSQRGRAGAVCVTPRFAIGNAMICALTRRGGDV